MKPFLFAVALALALVSDARASKCPPPVAAAALAAHPGAKVTGCDREHENGTTHWDVELTGPDGRELACEVSPDGTLLLTEEPIAWSAVPPEVARAYAAAHGPDPPLSVSKQTRPDGSVAFEVEFKEGGRRREATLDAPSSASDCPPPKPECVCPMIYAPVRCDGGCTYPNACVAACAGAKGCAPAEPGRPE
ncbi:MAG TPA: hypothetical protein VFB67_04180 [Candidatus Polarisedimenticolaceae bacterium]|nr:hypothetical protein [Candidatus Polarisedimenticolaceae bacterium]